MKVCKKCQYKNDDHMTFCFSCAEELPEVTLKRTHTAQSNKKYISPALKNKKERESNNNAPPGWIVLLSSSVAGLGILLLLLSKKFEKKNIKNADLYRTRTYVSLDDERVADSGRSTRRYPRYPITMEIRGIFDDNFEIQCITSDISLNGVGLISNVKVPENKKISIYFPPTKFNEKPIKISGTVVRSIQMKDNNYSLGIRFFHLFNDQEIYINQLIESCQ